ncbi:AraC family transcriptional regulator [Paenibacillus roseipurpureus]|uniref:AraC family transcriptional regulator n=1 Tax=Paenibacillus roseopurpureus TaxID=2918901 RepID=A0AA96LSJ0_9BACL|nr:AraC family transcriptional regulator [Paenibacillus sp. MBLB1832]WNR45761.1 AraC family transcriptional regulator [Paenibacillus sp. MBLB1832]
MKNYFSHCYPHAFEDDARIDQKFERIFNELEAPRVGSHLRVQAILIDLMVDVLQSIQSYRAESTHRDPKAENELRLNRIQEFVQNELHRPITAEEVAHLVFLSPRQINRLLQKQLGCSLMELIVKYRLEQAVYSLQHSNLSIEDIALCCGFTSRYYMYQVFRKYGYLPPAELRAHLQKL